MKLDLVPRFWHGVSVVWIHNMRRSQDNRRSGMTLLEIMIVIMIVGLLAGLAIPMMIKARRSTQITLFVSDLRVASSAFDVYGFEHRGQWPADVAPGGVPPGMEDYLTRVRWEQTTSLGGQWDWDPSIPGVVAVGVTADAATMQEVDDKLDDGNLATGLFRSGGSDYRYLVGQ